MQTREATSGVHNATAPVDAAAVREELERILASPQFRSQVVHLQGLAVLSHADEGSDKRSPQRNGSRGRGGGSRRAREDSRQSSVPISSRSFARIGGVEPCRRGKRQAESTTQRLPWTRRRFAKSSRGFSPVLSSDLKSFICKDWRC